MTEGIKVKSVLERYLPFSNADLDHDIGDSLSGVVGWVDGGTVGASITKPDTITCQLNDNGSDHDQIWVNVRYGEMSIPVSTTGEEGRAIIKFFGQFNEAKDGCIGLIFGDVVSTKWRGEFATYFRESQNYVGLNAYDSGYGMFYYGSGGYSIDQKNNQLTITKGALHEWTIVIYGSEDSSGNKIIRVHWYIDGSPMCDEMFYKEQSAYTYDLDLSVIRPFVWTPNGSSFKLRRLSITCP